MYPLGKQFEVDVSKSTSVKNVIKGVKFRITVITERVVRLEYNHDGNFVDLPTMNILNRNLGTPNYTVRQDKTSLSITTRYFRLEYSREQPFMGTKIDPMKNLKITLINQNDKDRERDWYYGHPEARNMGGNIVSLDYPLNNNLSRGLYSLEGFSSIDDSNTMVINPDGTLANKSGGVDVYVFMYGNDFNLALNDYFRMTGYPDLLPRYAFGNWWCKNTDYNYEEVNSLLNTFNKKKIPLSVLLLDKDWHIREYGNYKDLKTGFTFNRTLFPDPSLLVKSVHKNNVRVGLQINPSEGLFPMDEAYSQACGYLGVNNGDIVKYDPVNPRLMDVYMKLYLHPIEALGVDFFFSDYRDDSSINRMWADSHYLYLDSNRNPSKRGLVLSRGSVYTPHKYPVLYGGASEISWEDLRKVVEYYIRSSNMGISYISFDVGGNHGGIEEAELYIRNVQLGCFMPILRFHQARGPYYKKEPWVWDQKTFNIASDFLRLRHRLIPYIYTEAYKYTQVGMPIIQPIYHNYLWCYDDELYKNEYYFGSQLLVCPILNKKDTIMNRTIHRFYIPDGIWYDFFTGKKFPGGKKYVSFFRDDDYPVFAHAGSIIPLSNRSDMNNVGLPTDLEVQIFPGISNMYTMYEDDGITSLYKEGYFLKTSIDYNYMKSNYTVIIRSVEGKSGIVPERRNYKLVFRNTKHAEKVKVMFNKEEIEYSDYIDGNDYVVLINNVPTIGQVTVNCSGEDIEIDAVRVINDDIRSILVDLQINTYLKETLSDILFGDLDIPSKRIAIRKLKKNGLSREHLNLFLRLLDYVSEV